MNPYSYESMQVELEKLLKQYSSNFSVIEAGMTEDGRTLYEVVLGNPEAETKVLVHGGIHAREYITSELLIKVIEYYLKRAESEKMMRDWLADVCFYIVPMVNPDGITICQSGVLAIRKEQLRKNLLKFTAGNGPVPAYKANARGVDLNRNFNWGFYEYQGNKAPSTEKYKGAFPESEKESEFLGRLTRELKPSFTLSYHASGSELFWDYGQTGTLRERNFALVSKISTVTGYVIRYAATDLQDAAGYGDWCVRKKKIPSVTIEVGRGQAPFLEEEFERIYKENRELLFELTRY